MKKSTLLSLLTATSIVLTSAGTYAVWDTTTDNTTASVTFRNPVTVTVEPTYSLTTSPAALGSIETASGDVTFTVSNDKDLAKKLTLKPEISGGNGATINDFEFTITDKNDSSKSLSGSVTEGFVDTSLDSTIYTVTVTPKDGTQERTAGTAVDISLTATLSE